MFTICDTQHTKDYKVNNNRLNMYEFTISFYVTIQAMSEEFQTAITALSLTLTKEKQYFVLYSHFRCNFRMINLVSFFWKGRFSS